MTDEEVKRLALEALDYLKRGRKLPARLRRLSSICNDCESPKREWYMVSNEMWRKVNPAVHGHLCLSCLEKRLGRPLRQSDFGEDGISDEDNVAQTIFQTTVKPWPNLSQTVAKL